MTAPPLLAGATLALWGWQTQQLAVGVGAAALIESSRLVRLRVDLDVRDLARLWGVCWLATLGVVAYFIASTDPRAAIPAILQWLPMTLLPMAAAQRYGTLARIPLHVLTLRPARESPPLAVDLTYPYLAVCLLAAAAANVRTPIFFIALAALSAWALWTVRATRVSPTIWTALLVLVIGLGYAGQFGLNRLQGVVVDLATKLLIGGGSSTDPYRSTTALGRIGNRKASSTIVARVFPASPGAVPPRLHEATYDGFASPHWYANDSPLEHVNAPADGKTWILGDLRHVASRFSIATSTSGSRTILALPWGALGLEGLTVDRLLRNDLGAVEIHGQPQRLRYTVTVDPNASRQLWPTDRDLVVPEQERRHLAVLAAELDIHDVAPEQVIAILEQWFQSEFEYALFQRERTLSESPLAEFLTTHRAGHCEYFATATVLLLRTAGVPARYATGFAVQEFSEREQAYLLRERHAHAWARAYVNGRWRDVDTTPASWLSIESAQDSLLQPLSDYVSWLLYAYRQWRADSAPWQLGWAAWALLPVLGYVAWRLWQRRTSGVSRAYESTQGNATVPGLDSAFYRIDAVMRETEQARQPDEPISMWLDRLAQRAPGVPDLAGLREIAALHYRYRFDPLGLGHDERRRLGELVDAWLAKFEQPSRQ